MVLQSDEKKKKKAEKKMDQRKRCVRDKKYIYLNKNRERYKECDVFGRE